MLITKKDIDVFVDYENKKINAVNKFERNQETF